MLSSIEGDPTPAWGDRRKVYFQLMAESKKALNDVQRVHSVIWQDMPSLRLG